MIRPRMLPAAIVAIASATIAFAAVVSTQAPSGLSVPTFQYDPTFPQPLPAQWAVGAIGGMAIDARDHIWVLHRPAPLEPNERFT